MTEPDRIVMATRDFARRHPGRAAGLTVAQPFLPPEREMNFPSNSVQDLVAWLRGQGQHDTATLLQDVLDLANWGVGTFKTQPQAQRQLKAATPPGHDEGDYADALEGLAQQHAAGAAPAGAAAAPLALPSWLLPLVAELLQKILAGA